MVMLCGHCGSQVNEGFNVCPNCGATYRRNISLQALIVIAAAFLIGIIFIGIGSFLNVISGIILIIISMALFYFIWKKKWYRKND